MGYRGAGRVVSDQVAQHPLGATAETDRHTLLTVSDVPRDLNGADKLLEGRSYHACLKLCDLLEKAIPGVINPLGTSPLMAKLQIHARKLIALVQLGKFEDAQADIQSLGPLDDLQTQLSASGTIGSDNEVPFVLRLLKAQLPLFHRVGTADKGSSTSSPTPPERVGSMEHMYSSLVLPLQPSGMV